MTALGREVLLRPGQEDHAGRSRVLLATRLDSVEASGRVVTFPPLLAGRHLPPSVATGAGAIVDRNVRPGGRPALRQRRRRHRPVHLKSYGARAAGPRSCPTPAYQGPAKVPDHATVQRLQSDSAALGRRGSGTHRSTSRRASCRRRCSRACRPPSDPDQRLTEADSAETRNLVLNVGRANRCTTGGCGRRWPPSSTGMSWSSRRTKGTVDLALLRDPARHHRAHDRVLRRVRSRIRRGPGRCCSGPGASDAGPVRGFAYWARGAASKGGGPGDPAAAGGGRACSEVATKVSLRLGRVPGSATRRNWTRTRSAGCPISPTRHVHGSSWCAPDPGCTTVTAASP